MVDEVSVGKVVLKIRNGRLCLPGDYKDGDKLILTRNVSPSSCLALYTKEQWLPIRELLLKKGFLKRGKWQKLMCYVVGNAEDCIVEAGRIRISSHLAKATDLYGEALWIQHDAHIEIWNPKNFDEWAQK